MITRRSLTVLVFLVALCIPATASGKASMQLMLTASNGTKSKRVSATVTFPVPKKSTAANACKGKITFSVPIGKKTVKKKKRTIYSVKKASLKTVKGACAASANLNVPDALLGKRLKFTAVFKGNDAVKKFKTSKKFLFVVPPAPAPAFDPADGPWSATETGSMGELRQWPFTITPGNIVAQVGPRYGSIDVHCPGHADQTLGFFPQAPLAVFDTPFTITSNEFTAIDENTLGEQHTRLEMKFKFDSPTHGTGTFQLTGTMLAQVIFAAADELVPGCFSDVIPFELRMGALA